MSGDRISNSVAAWLSTAQSSMPIFKNYIVEVKLGPYELQRKGLYPIRRTLSCPARMTFHKLHKPLEIAFGGTWNEGYRFDVYHEVENSTDSCRHPMLKIMERGDIFAAEHNHSMPVSWPREPLPPMTVSKITRLNQMLDWPEMRGKLIVYEYNISSVGWYYHIKAGGRGPATSTPICIAGVGEQNLRCYSKDTIY